MNLPSERNVARKPPCTVLMLLTNSYDPDPRVRQEALALIRMGCRVKLLAWDRDLKSPAFESMEGVEVERVFLPSKHGRGTTQIFFYAWLYLKMFWRAWRTSFDAVHCHDLDTLPLGFAVGKLKRKPIVYDSHESFPDMLEGNVHPAVQRALVRLENFFIRRIDLLITVGEKLRRHFDQRGARHSVVVGNWKRLEEFSSTDEQNLEVRRRLGIPDDALDGGLHHAIASGPKNRGTAGRGRCLPGCLRHHRRQGNPGDDGHGMGGEKSAHPVCRLCGRRRESRRTPARATWCITDSIRKIRTRDSARPTSCLRRWPQGGR